jgi:hypothetical protein
MYPTPQATAIIAHQRQTQLLRHADRDRLVRVARVASPRTANLLPPPRPMRRWSRLTRAATHLGSRGRAAITATRSILKPASSLGAPR